MKIKLPNREPKEIELELEEGTLILMKVRTNKGYKLGELETVLEDENAIVLYDRPYSLGHIDVMGVDYPTVYYASGEMYGKKKFLIGSSDGQIKNIVAGSENIINYFVNHQEEAYRGHADLIRKIVEAQRGVNKNVFRSR